MNWIKRMLRDFLEIKESEYNSIGNVTALTNHAEEIFINKIWYRGSGYELEQVYNTMRDINGNEHFWGDKNAKIRKIHTGLPAMIIDTLADIVVDNLNTIKVFGREEEWKVIAKENNFKELIKMAVVSVLWGGDGAFKLSIDTDLSDKPIIEFYPADRVEYIYNRGRIEKYIFKTNKVINNKNYTLLEIYSKKEISYKLLDNTGNEVDINILEDSDKYKTIINNSGFIPALKFMIRKDYRHEGRGKSILTAKIDNFDAFDEVWSQWILAIRKGQIKTYIPENLLPRDLNSGRILRNNDFESDYIRLETDMSQDGKNQIQTTQGQIQHEALLSAYITALDQCLTGIISASTLGIDTKKLDNAEAQREKEKTTLYKVNQIIDILKDVLKELVILTFKFNDVINKIELKEPEVEVIFTSYANPSFEAQVETIGKAKTTGIMSIDTQVDQLWGDNKEEKWKKEEIERIKKEQGISEELEPAVNKDNINLKEEELRKIEESNLKNQPIE